MQLVLCHRNKALAIYPSQVKLEKSAEMEIVTLVLAILAFIVAFWSAISSHRSAKASEESIKVAEFATEAAIRGMEAQEELTAIEKRRRAEEIEPHIRLGFIYLYRDQIGNRTNLANVVLGDMQTVITYRRWDKLGPLISAYKSSWRARQKSGLSVKNVGKVDYQEAIIEILDSSNPYRSITYKEEISFPDSKSKCNIGPLRQGETKVIPLTKADNRYAHATFRISVSQNGETGSCVRIMV